MARSWWRGTTSGCRGFVPVIERRLAENEKLIVVIVSHPDAEYGLMVDLLDELKLAQARRISLKTMRGG